MDCSTPGLPVLHCLPELLKSMSIESVMPSNHLILRHHLLLLPSVFPSIRVFSNESVLHIRWPKYWSFSFSISPSNECSGLISFRMDWLDLLAVPGTLKSLLQQHSSRASILQRSAFFMVQHLISVKSRAHLLWHKVKSIPSFQLVPVKIQTHRLRFGNAYGCHWRRMGGRDSYRVWDGHVYTAIHKMDNQQGLTV